MLVSAVLLVLLPPALLVVFQLRSALGAWRGTALGTVGLLLLGSVVGALEWTRRQETPPPEDLTSLPPVSSQACFKCHESHYASWQRTFHRTMTRDATPEYVKADFNEAIHHYQGITSRLTRLGNRFFMETVDPEWEIHRTRQGIPLDKAGVPPSRVFSVDRLVGSHWFQQMMHRDDQGRYLRLPLAYHLVEKRWIHINGAFLMPDPKTFYSKTVVWNETCLYCHNTRPIKNPEPIPGDMPAYRTEVGELGIACEACHGPGDRHVRAHQNPARRLAQHYAGEGDPTIVNPARLSVARSDDICARCHGGTMPRFKEWNRVTFADPFLAGRELKRFWDLPFSEAEMRWLQAHGEDRDSSRPKRPEPLDGRFWGDGTPLTTAVEYQGLAMSACYQGGHGELRCLSCHSMHHSDPNHQVKDGMRTNAACYACHDEYRNRLVEHTHHPADSPGSLCYNCHMPYQVYSLLDTHRSHRISIPRIRDSLGTGKPHACNLCHLDKSLGWTQETLGKWYATTTRPEPPLSADERALAAGVLHLARDDARTRAVVAGAFGWTAAQQASGRDWPTPLLLRTLEHERYEAVRYTLHRALRSLHGSAADNYNYQGSEAERAAQVRELRRTLERHPPGGSRPKRSRDRYLPLTATGRLDDDVFDRLLRTRNDPDVTVNE
jgi:predicted CXXCH cytochrome family protein